MFQHRKSAAVLGGAALVIALAGCASAAVTASEEVELHQERAVPAKSGAMHMQGSRLAEYADALAAASSTTASSGAADAQGQRLAAHAAALAAADAAE